MKIGFIGLGIMGKPMAINLIKAGHELVALDHHQENEAVVAAAGARIVDRPAKVAEACDIVVTMLPNSPNVREAVCGDGGILEGARAGTILIDMSSIAPAVAQEVGAECAVKEVRMLDAPVSGGEPKAIDGTLAIMVGGEREVFEQVRDDVLLKVGASAVYCGALGAGNTTKLANQVIVAANIAACAEALTLAKKSGVDPEQVFEAIRGGLAGSTVMNAKAPMMLQGNFTPGFRIDLHIKDLDNALETAHACGSPLPLTAMVMEMLQILRADGRGKEDHSALAAYYAKVSGTRLNG